MHIIYSEPCRLAIASPPYDSKSQWQHSAMNCGVCIYVHASVCVNVNVLNIRVLNSSNIIHVTFHV